MVKLKLVDAEKRVFSLNGVPKKKIVNGRSIVDYRNYIRIAPGEIYETDDEVLANYLKNYKNKVRYNAETERALKQYNVPYEIEYCKSCGGRIRKISYKPIEVVK